MLLQIATNIDGLLSLLHIPHPFEIFKIYYESEIYLRLSWFAINRNLNWYLNVLQLVAYFTFLLEQPTGYELLLSNAAV